MEDENKKTNLVDIVRKFKCPTSEQITEYLGHDVKEAFLFAYALYFGEERHCHNHIALHQIDALIRMEGKNYLGKRLDKGYRTTIISHDDYEIARTFEEIFLIYDISKYFSGKEQADNIYCLTNKPSIILKEVEKTDKGEFDKDAYKTEWLNNIEDKIRAIKEEGKDPLEYDSLVHDISSAFKLNKDNIFFYDLAGYLYVRREDKINLEDLIGYIGTLKNRAFECSKRLVLKKLGEYEKRLTNDLKSKKKKFHAYINEKIDLFDFVSNEKEFIGKFQNYFKENGDLSANELRKTIKKESKKYFTDIKKLIDDMDYDDFKSQQDLFFRYGKRGYNYTILDHISIMAYCKLYIHEALGKPQTQIAKAADFIDNMRTITGDIFEQNKLIRKGECLVDYWMDLKKDKRTTSLVDRVYSLAHEELLITVYTTCDELSRKGDDRYSQHRDYLAYELKRLEEKYSMSAKKLLKERKERQKQQKLYK